MLVSFHILLVVICSISSAVAAPGVASLIGEIVVVGGEYFSSKMFVDGGFRTLPTAFGGSGTFLT